MEQERLCQKVIRQIKHFFIYENKTYFNTFLKLWRIIFLFSYFLIFFLTQMCSFEHWNPFPFLKKSHEARSKPVAKCR